MKNLLLIFNPYSGKGQAGQHLAQIINSLTVLGWLCSVYPTQGKEDATKIVSKIGNQFERIVCCGGDGTLHEVVSGIMSLSNRPPLGYIPTGSTNDFSKNLSLPRGISSIAETAGSGVIFPFDVGRFNSQYFVYVAAFGAFTEVSYNTNQQFKNIFGHLAYMLEGVLSLPALTSYTLDIVHDEGNISGEFLYGMVSNTVSVGGFRGFGLDFVSLEDGLFELVLVRAPKSLSQLHRLCSSLLLSSPESDDSIIIVHTQRIELSSTVSLPWTLDGEYGGTHEKIEIEAIPQAISLIRGNE